MTIGERIKAARENSGMTQVELGEKVGVSGVAIMRYEKNQRQPRYDQLQRIASALGVAAHELVDDWNVLDKEELKQVVIYGKGITDSPPQQKQDTTPQKPTYLCDNMRHCRDFSGLTQKALADKTGIPVKTIRAYENGNSGRFITEEDLQKIADAFGVSAKKLLGYSVTYEWMEKTYFQNAPPKERIIAALNQLNEKGQGIAVERVEELTSIPEYRVQQAPQSTPMPQEGNDTTPPSDAPQRPQEDGE